MMDTYGNYGAGGPMQTFQPQTTQGFVLCCLCGTNILPNPSNMCVNCIRSQVDITEGIQKQVTVLWCKECGRYLQPPKHWTRAEPESKELLTFCIKKIKGLNKVKLVDAGFIWTEPHSRRLKVKLTIQAEVFNGAILQQSFVVEYIVESNMCPDCNRANANPNSWVSCVQVRQHVYHKRTFFFLEQLILKHGADANTVKIKDIHEGVDFFYQSRAHALKFIDFLQSVVPIRFRADKQLISHDTHSNTYNYKYTFSVEIVPVCKDDLCCLPAKLASSLGQLGPMVLCTKVTNQLTLMDPVTLRTTTMDANVYWRHPFTAASSSKALVEYVVLDVELLGQTHHKYALAEVQVARSSDFGRNDTVFFAKTHLGHLLHPGDIALGYDLATAQLVGIDFEAFIAKGGSLPDVILVRKSFEEKRKRRKAKGVETRPWKLKHLQMEVEEAESVAGGGARARGKAADARQTEEQDRERFLQELEEDPEMRQRINIYKDPAALAALQQQPAAASRPAGLDEDDMGDDEDDEDLPAIPLEELLDDLEGLNIGGAAGGGDDDMEDEEMDDA
mmetsp:Transcript_25446/g.55257  ORF Transcript_25446/g.55257 Transcript_25446/m.55257 type:complete len:560 (+) Transcript_25446:171-1850(+)|eukprot:CAMPEP_0202893978 /NCGR_PEP_ID=MMETSP1392-20130828/3453_1 /ASSEMBLY_ACC=CAM_ASM_000868 /TAXON_ID=225041 /ORGANISM="Chlamydomonas chlamydogama, Strain SAG 11-48b" /LENGTH=559 /DNA_ID=CAMNT_0049578499 /DNA_START=158 /DNA_END=1837 /DNA_ORIENTATION=-